MLFFNNKTLVFFEKIYLSNMEHDVTTSKKTFSSLLSWKCMSIYFFENFIYVCKATTSKDKIAFLKFAIS